MTKFARLFLTPCLVLSFIAPSISAKSDPLSFKPTPTAVVLMPRGSGSAGGLSIDGNGIIYVYSEYPNEEVGAVDLTKQSYRRVWRRSSNTRLQIFEPDPRGGAFVGFSDGSDPHGKLRHVVRISADGRILKRWDLPARSQSNYEISATTRTSLWITATNGTLTEIPFDGSPIRAQRILGSDPLIIGGRDMLAFVRANVVQIGEPRIPYVVDHTYQFLPFGADFSYPNTGTEAVQPDDTLRFYFGRPIESIARVSRSGIGTMCAPPPKYDSFVYLTSDINGSYLVPDYTSIAYFDNECRLKTMFQLDYYSTPLTLLYDRFRRSLIYVSNRRNAVVELPLAPAPSLAGSQSPEPVPKPTA